MKGERHSVKTRLRPGWCLFIRQKTLSPYSLLPAAYHSMFWNRNGRKCMDDDDSRLFSDWKSVYRKWIVPVLLLAVALLMIGLLFIMLGVERIKGEAKHILRFVQEKSNFYHKYNPPLTVSGLLDCLKKEGFEVTEYPYGNYYCHQYIGQKYSVHFFVANNDTPDCPEAESYSKLFIQTVYGAGRAVGVTLARC